MRAPKDIVINKTICCGQFPQAEASLLGVDNADIDRENIIPIDVDADCLVLNDQLVCICGEVLLVYDEEHYSWEQLQKLDKATCSECQRRYSINYWSYYG